MNCRRASSWPTPSIVTSSTRRCCRSSSAMPTAGSRSTSRMNLPARRRKLTGCLRRKVLLSWPCASTGRKKKPWMVSGRRRRRRKRSEINLTDQPQEIPNYEKDTQIKPPIRSTHRRTGTHLHGQRCRHHSRRNQSYRRRRVHLRSADRDELCGHVRIRGGQELRSVQGAVQSDQQRSPRFHLQRYIGYYAEQRHAVF